MKNRILIFIIAIVLVGLFSVQELSAQLTSNASSRSWINVTSYYGVTNPNAFHLYIENLERLSGGEISLWRVKVKLDESFLVKNGNKTMGDFPPKFEIRFNDFVHGDASRIYSSSDYLQLSSTHWVSVIPESQLSLKESNSPGGNQFHLTFDLRVLEGCHLADFPGNHTLGLQFKVEDQHGNKIDGGRLASAGITLGINIPYGEKCPFPDTPDPEEPVFSYAIEIKGDAPNGLLEFNDINDYVNGVSKRYENGLHITSSTSYAVTVQSLTDNFIAIDASNNNTLPLNTVSLEVQNSTNSNILGTVPLSNGSQTIFNMQKEFDDNPQPHPFNIRYFTEPNDERLIKVKPDNYKTTLQYTLVPQ